MDRCNKIAIYRLQMSVSTLTGHKVYFFQSDSMLVFQLHNFSITLKSISLLLLNIDTISVVVILNCMLLMINSAKHFCIFWVDTFFISFFWEMLNCSPFHLFSLFSLSPYQFFLIILASTGICALFSYELVILYINIYI